MAKRMIETSVTGAGNSAIITWTFEGLGDLTLDMDAVSNENAARAMVHGMVQRVSDAAASFKTAAEKRDAMARLVEHYASGTSAWGVGRTTDGAGSAGGLTIRAVAAIQNVSVADMEARLKALAEKKGTTTRKLLATLASQPAVKAKMDELRPAPAANADALLEELA